MRLPSAVETGKKGIEQTKVETTVEVVPVQKTAIADRDRGIETVGGQDPVLGLVKGRDDGIIVIGHLLQDENGIEVEIGIPVDVIETVIVNIAIVTVIETVVIVLPKGTKSLFKNSSNWMSPNFHDIFSLIVMKKLVMFPPTIP